MSLYWYVSSKEELLDLMLDAIEAEIEVPEPTGDWRADLGAFAHRTRAALRQHRWAVEFIGTRPPSGPNDVRNLERLLSLLDGIGVDDYQLIMGIFMTVATFVIGAVIREAQEVRFQAEQERVEASMTAEEIQAEHERFRGWFEHAGRYPHIARLMEAGIDPDDPNTREERFQFSLDCVLDGIAARLTPEVSMHDARTIHAPAFPTPRRQASSAAWRSPGRRSGSRLPGRARCWPTTRACGSFGIPCSPCRPVCSNSGTTSPPMTPCTWRWPRPSACHC